MIDFKAPEAIVRRERIRAHLREHGLSINKFEQQHGLYYASIQKILANQRAMSYQMACRLSDIIGETRDYWTENSRI